MKHGQDLSDVLEQSYERIGKPRRILIAFSGGSDSVVLLHALLFLQSKEGFMLFCAHVNHGLRIKSDLEEEWTKALMLKWELPLLVRHVSVSKSGNLESAARNARYQALEEMREETQTDVIALAHHANDQAETMIMHLMRGAGPAGVAGMKEKSSFLWRPFLSLPKQDLQAFASQSTFSWLEDESNQDERFTRNRIRAQIMPAMEEISPGFTVRMAQTALLLQDENAMLADKTNEWMKKHAKAQAPFIFLMCEPFLEESLALKRRLLRQLCLSCNIELDLAQTEALLAHIKKPAGRTFNLPGGAIAFRTNKRLHIITNESGTIPFPWPPLKESQNTESLGDGIRTQTFDAKALRGAVLRQAQPGDQIVPLGMSGSQSLLKYLSGRRVDKPFRPFWPVLAVGDQVLWVIGQGPAQTGAVTKDCAKRIKLQFAGLLPEEIDDKGETPF